jgi:hypothetical protein
MRPNEARRPVGSQDDVQDRISHYHLRSGAMQSRPFTHLRRGLIATVALAAITAPAVLMAQAPAAPKIEDVAKTVADNGSYAPRMPVARD